MADETQAEIDPTNVEAQDPLPEARWLYRRIFTYGLTAALIAGAYVGVDYIGAVALAGSETAIRGLVDITKGALWLIGLLILFYLLAPSAEQLTRLVQAGHALQKGVTFIRTATATGSKGGSVTARTEASRDEGPATHRLPND